MKRVFLGAWMMEGLVSGSRGTIGRRRLDFLFGCLGLVFEGRELEW